MAALPVDPIETASDKLCALAWRVCTRDRSAHDDDPTIIRHLHDLAALGSREAVASAFATLLLVDRPRDNAPHIVRNNGWLLTAQPDYANGLSSRAPVGAKWSVFRVTTVRS
jgi:hypothetical protein